MAVVTRRRLDGARLPSRRLARALPLLEASMPRLHAAHGGFRIEGHVPELSRAFQDLVDLLSGQFGVGTKRVVLRDRPRPHRRRGGRIVYELHGSCEQEGTVEVYLRTAARAQPVALPTLLNTVLHEWMHHWDFETFGTSIHCRGFYERLRQVYRPLRVRLSA